MAHRSATPLISLDAVAIDTETTGLDPRRARIVEFAAVRISGGRLDESAAFRRLIRPDEPIPAAATRIHGIDDAATADAPGFAAAWPDCAGFLGDTVIVGHSIGFDIAVIRRECERAECVWPVPPALDIGLLARVAAPSLPDHSLETLASWLGIGLAGRHSALGDTVTAGRIFCALVPKLRECGIRTLAEATRACHELPGGVLEGQHRAGWDETVPVWDRPASQASDPQAETGPYLHRVGAIMTSPARSVGPDTTLGAALKLMAGERVSSLFVSAGGAPAASIGIVTERDALRALAMRGAAAFDRPVGDVMSRPLVTVPAHALAYVAIGRMNRLGFRHLGVTDDAGRVVGALSARDLLRLRTGRAIELGDEVTTAKDVHDLGRSWARLTEVVTGLLEAGLAARDIAAVISQNVIDTTRRAAQLADDAMTDSGQGPAPAGYAFVVLGSAGRGESLLAMDQDNALIYADDAPAGADRWFEQFASRVNDILHHVGIPYCSGGVMAKNPIWRGSQAEWRERIDRWVLRSNPQDLLSVDIFFDLHAAHGDAEMADRLWRYAFEAARDKPEFAKLLIAAIGAMPAGRNWFGGLRSEQGRIDLKRTGLFGIVSVARALAVCHHVVERSTPARLSGLLALKLGVESDLDALTDAHGVLLDLILDQQVDDIKRGRTPTNKVEVQRLSRRDRSRLRAALQAAENVDEIARSLLFGN